MEQRKRQRHGNFEENKRKKFTIKTDSNVTQIEDLPNEVMYEIFGFLDSFEIYRSFFNLNYRFRSLLMELILPFKISIPLMSSSLFDCYNRDIIIPNQSLIYSMEILNSFMYDDEILSLSKKTSLRTLILENIQTNRLTNLLGQLTSLPYLSSLSISIVDPVLSQTALYRLIFPLPSLRYFRLLLGNQYYINVSPCLLNEQSSIEHLIVDSKVKHNKLNNLLSYVPQLRYFSLHLSQDYQNTITYVSRYVLKNLTHLSIKCSYGVTFTTLRFILINHFPSVEVLRISGQIRPIGANQWKQLISTFLTKLRIFDALFEIDLFNDTEKAAYEEQVQLFQSSFWIERQWFFHSRLGKKRLLERRVLFTMNPYRREHYELHEQSNEITIENENRTIFKSVHNMVISNEKAIDQCVHYFPNVNQLTLSDSFPMQTYRTIASDLSRILPLQKLKILVIESHRFALSKMIELLSFMPNLHTLTFQRMPLFEETKTFMEQNEEFQSILKTNSITTVACREKCTFEKLEILLMLFPRLQHLGMNIEIEDMISILRFVLDKNTHHLILISLIPASHMYFEYLNSLINSRILPSNCRTMHTGQKLCLWR